MRARRRAPALAIARFCAHPYVAFPLGFTWYSLTDQIDWDTALPEKNGHVNDCRLFDLDRKIRPVGTEYQRLISLWRDTLPTESYSIRADY